MKLCGKHSSLSSLTRSCTSLRNATNANPAIIGQALALRRFEYSKTCMIITTPKWPVPTGYNRCCVEPTGRGATIRFSVRLRTAIKARPLEQHLSTWLRDMQLLQITPDDILGVQLVTLCRTQGDLDELKKILPAAIWNSTGVLNSRIIVSSRVPGAEQEVHAWLQEMQAFNVLPDRITGNCLVGLCKTQMDFDQLREFLPPSLWNNTTVFTSRIVVSTRMRDTQKHLGWWLHEARLCKVHPNEVTGNALISLCKSVADFDELEKFLPPAVWNSSSVFANRMASSIRIPGASLDLNVWLREMNLCEIRPDDRIGNALVSLCNTQADLEQLKCILPSTVWNSVSIFTKRLAILMRIPGASLDLRAWLREMNLHEMQPDEITGVLLVSLCKTQADLADLKRSLPDVVWNSNCVFTNRIVISARIFGAGHELRWWLREMRLCRVEPDEITGVELVSLCSTQSDLDDVQRSLPATVWNSTGVFTNRLVATCRMRSGEVELRSWLKEMQMCSVQPNEHTAVQLMRLCRTEGEVLEVKMHLLDAVWNHPKVFNKRIKVSALVSPYPKPLSYWLDELREGGVVPNELSGQLLLSLCTSKSDLLLLRRYFPALVRDDETVPVSALSGHIKCNYQTDDLQFSDLSLK